MIRRPHLLREHSNFSLFWRTILERLSIHDAPFFSSIQDDYIQIGQETISLMKKPSDIVAFCGRQWTIPPPLAAWHDIKKDYVRSLLLQDFLARKALPVSCILRLQHLITEKIIPSQHIIFEAGKIIEIQNFENLQWT